MLAGDCISRGGEILSGRVAAPKPGAGKHAEFTDQTIILSQLCPPILQHNRVPIATKPDLYEQGLGEELYNVILLMFRRAPSV